MKPLLINTFDRGGAANACIRLHQGLMNKNIDSELLVTHKDRNDVGEIHQISKDCISINFKTKVTFKLKNILKELKIYLPDNDNFIISRSKGLEMFNYPYSIYDITKSQLYQQADIINLHWVASFLDYPTFFKKNTKPVVWTLHDQNPFSGGEHYKEEYIGIDNKGYPVKRVLSKLEKQKFNEILKVKKEALSNVNNLHIVALCKWMEKEAKNSDIFNKYPFTIIPNGIDTTTFKPRDKIYSRELLNIPQNKKVILFVSDSVENKRKGFEFLQRALDQIKRDDIILLPVGAKGSTLSQKQNIKELGYVRDELLMSILYSAADVFIIPSLMDNLPNTVLESIMCGTPVIGFPVGGIPDMIQHGENGLLTEEISVPALVKTINDFLDNPEYFNREEIRKNAVKKYALNIQAQAYIKLYNKILTNSL